MNLKDIAELAGVSTATVSRVINRSGPVSKATAGRVLRIIEEHGYVPDTIAKSLRMGQTKTIGFVVPDISNPFFPEVLNGAEAVCAGYGYNIILGNTNEDIDTESKVVRNLRQQRADGVLMILVDESGSTLRSGLAGASPSLPIVFIDRHIAGFRYDSVIIDNEGGTAQAAEYLIELGHTKIAIIHGPANTTPGGRRLYGYRKAMRAAGVAIRSEYVVEGDFRTRSGYELTRALMEIPDPPTAIIGGNNLMTIGAFQCLADMGICVPHDVSLIGFDDFALASNLSPAITVVDRPTADMGRISAELLLSRIEKRDESATRQVVLPTRLKIRDSCRRLA